MTNKLALPILVLLILHSFRIFSQPALNWEKHPGSKQAEKGLVVACDTAGNVFCVGQYSDSTDFDAGPGTLYLPASLQSQFVAKYSPTGALLWVKRIPGAVAYAYDIPTDIEVNKNGDVLICGIFLGTEDFDPGAGSFTLTSNGNTDVFILKLDQNGNFVSALSFGGSSVDQTFNLALDFSGNILVTGFYSNQVDFDPGGGTFTATPLPSSTTGLFISKLDENGNFKWVKSININGDDIPKSICADKSNAIYVTGFFNSPIDFDPGVPVFTLSPSSLNRDIFLLKLDSNGVFRWARNIGSTKDDVANSVASYGSEVFMTGTYQGTVDFDPGPATYTQTGGTIFISRFDTAGSHVWTKTLVGETVNGQPKHENFGKQIRVDKSGKLTVAGLFGGEVDFDPSQSGYSLTAVSVSDVFFCQFDVNGNFLCAGQISCSNGNWSNSLALGKNGSVFITGGFSGTADMDPHPVSSTSVTAQGVEDIFLVNALGCTNIYSSMEELSAEKAILLFPNPSTGHFNVRLLNAGIDQEIISIYITDLTGRIVHAASAKELGAGMTLPVFLTQSPGVYILNVNGSYIKLQEKIVITD